MLSQSIEPAARVVKLKSGSSFCAPLSWKLEELESHIRLNGPEDDLNIDFLELPLTENIETLVNTAWKQLNSDFILKIAMQLSLPISGSWETCHQIVYDVPISEARVCIAYVRTIKDTAYINLIQGKMAALQRRGADLQLMMESFKPNGFKEQSLKNSPVKEWTVQDKEDFDTFVLMGMEKLKVPGLAIAIVCKDSKIIHSKGYGVKKLNSEEPVNVDTPFMIGSTTKALTTFLMGTLVDKQKLAWDTPVTEVLQDFSLQDAELTKLLTARLAVSASTGMPRRDLDFIFNYSGVKPEDRLAQMKTMKPTTGLGETFQYSNFLFMAGGYMAAKAYAPSPNLEASYAKAMKDLVFEPLNMKNTVLKVEDALSRGAALPHSADFNGECREIPLGLEEACYSVAPAGAVWSTVEDMSQYLIAELNNGEFFGKKVISKQALNERRKPGIRMGEKSFYGLGMIINEEQGLQILSHGGATLGFSSDMFFYPEKGIGMVILANSRYAHPFLNAVKQKFLELTLGAKPQVEKLMDMSVAMLSEITKQTRQNVFLEGEKLSWIKQFEGEYTNLHLGNAKIYLTMEGYKMAFKGWESRIGAEVEKNGKKLLVLIDPPSFGSCRLQVANNHCNLILDAGQEQYEFVAQN